MTGPEGSTITAAVLRMLRVLHAQLGWVSCAVGVLLCALGWYGVSGERYSARQIPYLASATVPGAALIVGGMVLLAARSRGAGAGAATDAVRATPEQEQMHRQTALLYQLLTKELDLPTDPTDLTVRRKDVGEAAGASSAPSAEQLLSVPGGRTYHRADCPLVQGRQDPEPTAPDAVAARGLRPCPLCEPPEA